MQGFTPEFIEAARPCRHAPGDRWFVDETYVKVSGQWAYLYRDPSNLCWLRFPREVISVAVRWYLRYACPGRTGVPQEPAELLAEHGATVDHVTIYRWVQRFAPEFIEGCPAVPPRSR